MVESLHLLNDISNVEVFVFDVDAFPIKKELALRDLRILYVCMLDDLLNFVGNDGRGGELLQHDLLHDLLLLDRQYL